MPPCPVPAHLLPSRPGSPLADNTYPEHFDPLPEQSVRTALILNRFTINCTVQSEAADVQQSDQDAQTLGSTFLTACADFNFPTDGAAKSQASGFITSHLAGLQGEQPPLTQTVGPVMLSLGKAAPGFYFLNMRH